MIFGSRDIVGLMTMMSGMPMMMLMMIMTCYDYIIIIIIINNNNNSNNNNIYIYIILYIYYTIYILYYMYISCDSLSQYHNCQCLLSVSIFLLRSPSLPRFKTQAPLIVVKRGKIPNVMNTVDPVWQNAASIHRKQDQQRLAHAKLGAVARMLVFLKTANQRMHENVGIQAST